MSLELFTGLRLSDGSANSLLCTDADKDVVSVTNLASWVAGTANQVTVTDDGDGTITLSGPQDLAVTSTPAFHRVILRNAIATSPYLSCKSYNNVTSGTVIYFDSGRGTYASPAASQNTDILGTIVARGLNSELNTVPAASITFNVAAEPNSGGDTTDMPGKIVFSTTPDGSGTLAVSMIIDHDQSVRGLGKIRADTNFNINGTDGITTTFLDADGNTISVVGGIITAKTAP
jgi:hypothetical protein